MESFPTELVSKSAHIYFQTIKWALSQNVYQSNWIRKVIGRLQFRKDPTQCTDCLRIENKRFLARNFQNWEKLYYLEPGLYSSLTDIVQAMNTLIQETHNHSKIVSQLKCLQERK